MYGYIYYTVSIYLSYTWSQFYSCRVHPLHSAEKKRERMYPFQKKFLCGITIFSLILLYSSPTHSKFDYYSRKKSILTCTGCTHHLLFYALIPRVPPSPPSLYESNINILCSRVYFSAYTLNYFVIGINLRYKKSECTPRHQV